MDDSQLVNAYNASMVLSGDNPEGKCTNISTSAAVLSSIFLTLILPLSLAFNLLIVLRQYPHHLVLKAKET